MAASEYLRPLLPETGEPSRADSLLFRGPGQEYDGVEEELPPLPEPGSEEPEIGPDAFAPLAEIGAQVPAVETPQPQPQQPAGVTKGGEFKRWEDIEASDDFKNASPEEKAGAAELWGNYAQEYLRVNSDDDDAFVRDFPTLGAHIETVKGKVIPGYTESRKKAIDEQRDVYLSIYGLKETPALEELPPMPEYEENTYVARRGIVKSNTKKAAEDFTRAISGLEEIQRGVKQGAKLEPSTVFAMVARAQEAKARLDKADAQAKEVGKDPAPFLKSAQSATAQGLSSTVAGLGRGVGYIADILSGVKETEEHYESNAKRMEEMGLPTAAAEERRKLAEMRDKFRKIDDAGLQGDASRAAQAAYEANNVNADAPNATAQLGRGVGDVAALAPSIFAGIAPAVLQMGASTYESSFTAKEAELRASGMTDENAIVDAANEYASGKMVGAAPAFAAYLVGGKLAGSAVAKLLPNASPIVRAVAGFGTATAANVAVGGTARWLEGENFTPTLRQFTADALFGLMGGREAFKQGESAQGREQWAWEQFEQWRRSEAQKAGTRNKGEAAEDGAPVIDGEFTVDNGLALPAPRGPLSTERAAEPSPAFTPTETLSLEAPAQRGRENTATPPEVITPEPPAAPAEPVPSDAPVAASTERAPEPVNGDNTPTQGEASFAGSLDTRRSQLEIAAEKLGAKDAELAAATAITDVLATYDPNKPLDDAGIEAALYNRVKQVVANEYRAEQTAKRGGGVEKQSLDATREDSLSPAETTPDAGATPDRAASNAELSQRIAEEANNMGAHEREILFGIQEGKSLREIAEDLGISQSSAQRKWAKVQSALQKKLAEFRQSEAGAVGLGSFFEARRRAIRSNPAPVNLSQILVAPYSLGNIRRKAARMWLGKNGAFPPEFRNIQRSAGHREVAVKSQFALLAKDLSAALDEAGALPGTSRAAQSDLVAQFMETNTAALFSLATPRLQDAARRARMALDTVSGALVAEGAVPTSLGHVIMGNVGGWLRRYYAAFDPQANWNYDSLTERSGGTDAAASTARRILDNARTFIHTDLQRRGLPRSPEIIEAVMRTLTDRQQMETWMQGGGTNVNVGSFLMRQKLAPEIRELMGEEKNPVLRTERSGAFLSQAIVRHRAQIELRRAGLMAGLFWPAQRGRFSVPVPSPNPGRSPWRGLYTTPEMASAMTEARLYGDDTTTATGMMAKIYNRMVGETKFNLVAANPRSTVVNAIGGLFQSIANGTFFVPPGASAKYARGAFNAVFRGDGTIDPSGAGAAMQQRIRNLHSEMIAAGILDNNVSMGDFESTISDTLRLEVLDRDAQRIDRGAGAVRGALTGYASTLVSTGSRTLGIVGAAIGGAGGAVAGSDRITRFQRALGRAVIGQPDSFWKVWNWLDNYATQLKAGTPLKEAMTIASDRTTDTMPSYDKIPEALRRVMTKIPGANVFFQFIWELYRNNYNNLRIGIQDLASPHPELKKAGARRIIGATTLLGLAAGVVALAKQAWDWDDDKDKAFRRSAAPEWDRNALIVPRKVEHGNVTYINGKYMTPQLTFAELVQAARDGKDPADVVGKAVGAVLDDFVKSNAALDPSIEAVNNRKMQTGKPITAEKGLEGAVDRFDYFVTKTMAPGVAQEAGKMRMATTGEQSGYGRTYSWSERLYGLAGLRENTYDLKQQLSFRLADVDRAYSEIKKMERTEGTKVAMMEPAKRDARLAEIKAQGEKLRAEGKANIVQLFSDYLTLGITPEELYRQQADKRTGLPNELRLTWLAVAMREAGIKNITPETVATAMRNAVPK